MLSFRFPYLRYLLCLPFFQKKGFFSSFESERESKGKFKLMYVRTLLL